MSCEQEPGHSALPFMNLITPQLTQLAVCQALNGCHSQVANLPLVASLLLVAMSFAPSSVLAGKEHRASNSNCFIFCAVVRCGDTFDTETKGEGASTDKAAKPQS